MTTVNTATLKQQLSHYLGLVKQGKEVLITNHKRVIARLLAEELSGSRLPLIPPTRSPSELKTIGGFGLDTDPVEPLIRDRRKR